VTPSPQRYGEKKHQKNSGGEANLKRIRASAESPSSIFKKDNDLKSQQSKLESLPQRVENRKVIRAMKGKKSRGKQSQ
jgi:hypothetical protein